jgi:hypothetical protein
MSDEHEAHAHNTDSHGHEAHTHDAYPNLGETSELAQEGVTGAVCPRCESWQVVAGHLLDGLGQKVRFGLIYRGRAPGVSDNEAPPVLALYCNACGELTFTLE